jgi:hypothetical protein
MEEIGKKYSGKSINELGKKFYKITNKYEKKFGFQYHDGLNECRKDGLLFIDLNNIIYDLYDCTWIREVILPDDALIYVGYNEYCKNKYYKANKFILKEKIAINKFYKWLDYDFCKLAVQYNGDLLQFVDPKNKSNEIYKLAVQQNGMALEFVQIDDLTEDLSNEIYKLAVQQCGMALTFIRPTDLSEEICKLAILQNAYVLRFIPSEKQTDEICKIAIQRDWNTLQFVSLDKRTDEMRKLAVKCSGSILRFAN